MNSFFNRFKTFRQTKCSSAKVNKNLCTFRSHALRTMGTKSMSVLVRLPPGENLNEWIAVNAIDFFNELNLLVGAIQEKCTQKTCPTMCAGSYQYFWQDDVTVKTPTSMSAIEYIDTLFGWAEMQFNDESIFPIENTSEFPKDFIKRVCKIMRRFFRIYAHIYYHHMSDITAIQADEMLNSCFKHLVFFAIEFNLIDQKELNTLEDVITPLKAHDKEPAVAKSN